MSVILHAHNNTAVSKQFWSFYFGSRDTQGLDFWVLPYQEKTKWAKLLVEQFVTIGKTKSISQRSRIFEMLEMKECHSTCWHYYWQHRYQRLQRFREEELRGSQGYPWVCSTIPWSQASSRVVGSSWCSHRSPWAPWRNCFGAPICNDKGGKLRLHCMYRGQ